MPLDGRFPAVELTFTIAPPPAACIPGSDGADRPDVAHDVQLPELVPVRVGELLERPLVRDADVVDETPHRPDFRLDAREDLGGRLRSREIDRDPERGAGFRLGGLDPLFASAGDDDARAFLREEPRGLEPDPGRRAGDEADAVFEPEAHGQTISRGRGERPRRRWKRMRRLVAVLAVTLGVLASSAPASAAPTITDADRLERAVVAR